MLNVQKLINQSISVSWHLWKTGFWPRRCQGSPSFGAWGSGGGEKGNFKTQLPWRLSQQDYPWEKDTQGLEQPGCAERRCCELLAEVLTQGIEISLWDQSGAQSGPGYQGYAGLGRLGHTSEPSGHASDSVPAPWQWALNKCRETAQWGWWGFVLAVCSGLVSPLLWSYFFLCVQ